MKYQIGDTVAWLGANSIDHIYVVTGRTVSNKYEIGTRLKDGSLLYHRSVEEKNLCVYKNRYKLRNRTIDRILKEL